LLTGTLKDKDIQENILVEVLWYPETFTWYSVHTIQIEEEFVETYPIITPTNNSLDCIDGITELTQKDLELADTYEGKYHRRIGYYYNPKKRFGYTAP
jgi:hypothetical protein